MYILRCNETQQVAFVSELRVAAYPFGEINTLAGSIINCTKAELDVEIAARAALVEKLGSVSVAGGGSAGTLKLQVVP